MIKMMTDNIRRVLTAIKLIATENDQDVIIEHEITIYSFVVGVNILSLVFYGGILSFYWEKPPAETLIFSVISLIASFFLFRIPGYKFNNNKKYHLLSFLLCSQYLLMFYFFYKEVSFVMWVTLLTSVCIASFSVSKILFNYVFATAFIAYVLEEIFLKSRMVIVLDSVLRFSFFCVLIYLFALLYVLHRIYKNVVIFKNTQFRNLLEQKDEINSLYEEAYAHEEELSSKNDTLNFLAFYDNLTALPNRKKIKQRLEETINASDSEKTFYLVYIDLDNFKKVNDTLGHNVGDQLIQRVSVRLIEMLEDGDELGHLGADEFAIIVNSKSERTELDNYLRDIQQELSKPFAVNKYEMTISASMGVAKWPEDCNTSDEMLKASDSAMFKAKEAGKNEIYYYEKISETQLLDRLKLENKLVSAMDNNELYMVYQPIVDSQTECPISFEALMRWETSEIGFVGPDVFIPMMEDMGLIYKVGLFAIKAVCNKIIDLEKKYGINFNISINISALQIIKPSFVDDVERIVKASGINPASLCMELTESVFISNMELVIEKVDKLRSMGIVVALDDFGTGYSSLSYLVNLPITSLKIDKSFIDKLDSESDIGKNLVLAIITMAKSLGMNVVAEGVEKKSQLDFLRDNKCTLLQGYYFSKPLKEADLNKYLSEKNYSPLS